MFFDFDCLTAHTSMVLLKRTIIDCAHMKWNSHVNLMKQSENLEDHEKWLSFIFHLFVKSLINISDVCGWPLYWNFVELASSESSHTTAPRASPYMRTPHSWTGTDAQNSSGAAGIRRVWAENGAIWCKRVAQFDCGCAALVTSGVVWSQTLTLQSTFIKKNKT